MVVVDAVGNFAQMFAQLDFFLAAKAEARHRARDGGKNRDDRADGDQFGHREAAVTSQLAAVSAQFSAASNCELRAGDCELHSTFAFPPATADITSMPFTSLNAGFSITRYVSPTRPPRTRRPTTSPPLAKTSGLPSDDTMRIVPASLLIVATGGVFGSIFSASPNITSDTSIECGSKCRRIELALNPSRSIPTTFHTFSSPGLMARFDGCGP